MVHNMFRTRARCASTMYSAYSVCGGFRRAKARGGAYVTYDYEAMIAILTIEASRVNGLVVGEDLGTVPDYVRTVLGEHGLLGCMVEWFARVDDSPQRRRPVRRSVHVPQVRAGFRHHARPAADRRLPAVRARQAARTAAPAVRPGRGVPGFRHRRTRRDDGPFSWSPA